MAVPRPVVIVPYDRRWPVLFETARVEIAAAVGALVESIDHIGSTSVPGLAAKPIVDIEVGVRDWDEAHATVVPLVAAGWAYRGENGIPRRHFFERDVEGTRYHLHMFEVASDDYRRHLQFRDYLRGHPDVAAEYAELKRALARRHGSDREAYTEAKTAFIRAVEGLAERASAEAGAPGPAAG